LDLPGAVDIKKVLPYPYNDHRFVVATNQALYLLDVDKLTLEQIAMGVNDFFIEGQNNIAWVKEGQVKLFNLPLRSETVALELGADNGPLRDLKDVSSTWLALNESGEFVSLNLKSDPETIGSSVKSFSLSPKEEDIAILKQNGSLSIYNLESKISVDIDSSGVTTDTAWFKDAVHIFLLKGSTLIFAEVSNAHLENSVVLAKDVSETDKYNRLLRYVYVKRDNGNLIFINDYLVRQGFAKASTYPPDVKFATQFVEAEREARENQRGLWGKCTM